MERICPSCHCSFKQEFLCATCGAEKLRDASMLQMERALHSKQESLMMQTNEIESLRQQLSEYEKQIVDDMNLQRRLRRETQDQSAEIAGNHAMLGLMKQQLAECQRDRDENQKRYLRQLVETKLSQSKLVEQLATVIKQRDELVEYKRDADRWNGISALMFACSLVELTQDEGGGYCISATEPVENYLPASWSGDTPEAVIDAALAKLGADKAGEG